MYEQRLKNRPDWFDEIVNNYSHLRLPQGPHGLSGQAASDRVLLVAAGASLAAKLLHRAMLSPEHRAHAVWYVENAKHTDLAILSREWEALKRIAASGAPTRVHVRRRPMTITVDERHFTWLESLGPNLSANAREVFDAAMGVES